MIRRSTALIAGAMLLGAMLTGAGPAAAQGKKLVIALPGIPPIFSVTIAYVAEKQGFFKKHGADVEIRPFDNGTAAARAVVAGDIDMAWSPTPPVINQISNADVPLVALYGMPNPDWVIGASETGKTCKDMAGQDVGVDFDQWRALRCPSLHAHRRLSWHEDRGCETGCARLGPRTGTHCRPPALCRAAPRRPRRDRGAGQEAQYPAGHEEYQSRPAIISCWWRARTT